MLRIRRLLTSKLLEVLRQKNAEQPEAMQWPDEALVKRAEEQVTLDLKSVQPWPTRKLRELVAQL